MSLHDVLARLQSTPDKTSVLKTLPSDHPFWIGGSYASDPFIGRIVKLPLDDPRRYGAGVDARIFDKLAKAILDGRLAGDPLVLALEQFSRYCTETDWTQWYRPILEGQLDLQIPLAVFNEHSPTEFRIPPPAISRARVIKSIKELPPVCVLQPLYEGQKTLWFINSKDHPAEIRGYTDDIRRYHALGIEQEIDRLTKKSMDVVVFGTIAGGHLVAEDVLSRDQFTREGTAPILRQRINTLRALEDMGFEVSQFTDEVTGEDFYREFNLILEQGFTGIVVRDPAAHYPFRVASDILIEPKKGSVVTMTGHTEVAIIGSVRNGCRVEVRLGLTDSIRRNILSLPAGRQFDVVSCGFHDGTLTFPIFKGWRK